jgi:hypothetical protein
MDADTRFLADMAAVAADRRATDALAVEVCERLRAAKAAERAARRHGSSVRAALTAGALADWTHAPVMRDAREATAARWGISPRTSHSFYLDEPLGRRTLTAADSGAAAELVGVANPLRIAAQRDTASEVLGLMTTVTAAGRGGDQILGQLGTLPAGAVLASETAALTDQTPAAGQSLLSPRNITAFAQWNRTFALQSDGGAEAVTRLAAAGARNKLLQQILEGTGANGEIEGLLNISAVPTTDGGTITWAMVADSIADVEANSSGQNLAWVVTAAAAEVMRQRAAVSNVSAILADGRIGGYPVFVTGCTSSAVAVFGAWADMLLYQWAPIEVGTDPYGVNSANFRAQLVSVRAWITADAAPLLTGSFSTIHSIT